MVGALGRRSLLVAGLLLGGSVVLEGCTMGTLRLPEAPAVPRWMMAPDPPVPQPGAAPYVAPEPKIESQPTKRISLAGVPIALAPIPGADLPGLRAELLKALLKGNLRVRDYDGAGRILTGYRRGVAGASTDFYGLLPDVMRVAPATVGGIVLWPEVVEVRRRTVEAGGTPFVPADAEAAWQEAKAAYATERTRRLEKLEADLVRYRAAFEAAWSDYLTKRNFLQVANDGADGPDERRRYRGILADAEAARDRLAGADAANPRTAAAQAATKPQYLDVTSARLRILVCDARTGEIAGVHEIEVEARSTDELATRIAEATSKALGVKR